MKLLSLTLNIVMLFLCGSCSQNTPANPSDVPTPNTLSIGGTQLAHVVKGSGKTCLVLGSSVYYPRTFSPDLYDHLTLHFVDLRWFPQTVNTPNLETYTIDSIVAEIEAIRKALGLQDFVLIGHSIHGTIAFEYARKYAEKLSHLVMIGSPNEFENAQYQQAVHTLWDSASGHRKALESKIWEQAPNLDTLSGQDKLIEIYCLRSPRYWYDAEYDARPLWAGMTIDTQLSDHLFGNLFYDYSLLNHEDTVTVPVFLGLGKYDYVVPYTTWKTPYVQIPNLTRILFERSGHTPQLEEPEKFNSALLQWLDSH